MSKEKDKLLGSLNNLYGLNELIDLEDLTLVLQRQIEKYSNSYQQDLKAIKKCLKQFNTETKEDGTVVVVGLKNRSPEKGLEIYEQCKKLAFNLMKIVAEDEKMKKFYSDNFGTIVYTLTAITDKKLGDINLRKTVFDVELKGKTKYVGLQGDELRIRLSSVNKEIKEMQLKKEAKERIKKIWEYMSIHYNNYRKCLEDSTTGELNGGHVNEGQWEHMMVHETTEFTKIRSFLSANAQIRNQVNDEDQKHLKEIYGKEVYPTNWNKVHGKEHTVEAWKHYVRSKGKLNGLTLGDLGNMQLKANQSELSLSSFTNMYNLLKMLEDFLINGLSDSENLAKNYAIESFFSEEACQITQSFVDEMKDDVTKKLLQEILDSKSKTIKIRTS